MNNKSGILKKSKYDTSSKNVEFLVFGYHCKLYRDDQKALMFDKQEHLINAPYDPKDSISRYDVRATLSDITPFEASAHSYPNRLDGLSQAEQQAEQLAEEERYYSLYRNEVEEEMYKEEQEKRQTNSGYNQVAFNYEESSNEIVGPKESSDVQQENDDNDDSPFTPSEELSLPADMEYPSSLKLNQIIEKTAKFISSQGPQMEILLKTKQSSNPQFEFLNHNGQYNAYYKHILAMMKNNTYPWQNSKSDENSRDNDDNSNTNDSNIEEPTTSTTIIIPKMQFKPSADCAYTQLISKITKAPISELERKNEEEIKKKQAENNLEPSKVIGSLGLVASYNSDSDSNDEDDENEPEEYKGAVPPSEIQIVIDKTAAYVAKNGPEFEQKLIFKQDSRFQFLHENDDYHLYYKMKVKSYQSPNQAINNSYKIQPTVSTTKSIEPPKKEEIVLPKAPPAPVSFSIKTKEERQPLKSTNMENSDEEINKVPDAPSPPRITSIEEELERQVDIIATEREEKLAKERLNDKLLSAAREKLGMLPKEKMLQIERKKKAMLFINQIKGSNGSSSNGGSKREDDIINLTQCGEDSNDSVSVKSLTMSEKSRSRKNSSSRSSRSSSRSRSSSSRSSDSSPKRKHSKKKSHRKRKYRRSRSRSRSRSPARYKHSKRW